MGLFTKNIDKIKEDAKKEIAEILLDGEKILAIYLLLEDYVVLTNHRLIAVDKMWTSTKKTITSIPYKSITAFSLARGGFMSFSKEFEVYVGAHKHEFKFYNENESVHMYKNLARFLM